MPMASTGIEAKTSIEYAENAMFGAVVNCARNPPLARDEEPCAIDAFDSNTVTSTPIEVSASAHASPITPAPITATSVIDRMLPCDGGPREARAPEGAAVRSSAPAVAVCSAVAVLAAHAVLAAVAVDLGLMRGLRGVVGGLPLGLRRGAIGGRGIVGGIAEGLRVTVRGEVLQGVDETRVGVGDAVPIDVLDRVVQAGCRLVRRGRRRRV